MRAMISRVYDRQNELNEMYIKIASLFPEGISKTRLTKIGYLINTDMLLNHTTFFSTYLGYNIMRYLPEIDYKYKKLLFKDKYIVKEKYLTIDNNIKKVLIKYGVIE